MVNRNYYNLEKWRNLAGTQAFNYHVMTTPFGKLSFAFMEMNNSFWFNEKKTNFLSFTYVLQSAGEISHTDFFCAIDLHYHRGLATFSILHCKFSLRDMFIVLSQWPMSHHWTASSSHKALTKVDQLIG